MSTITIHTMMKEVAKDKKVNEILDQLTCGIVAELHTGKFPAKAEDWECRLAERVAEMIKEFKDWNYQKIDSDLHDSAHFLGQGFE